MRTLKVNTDQCTLSRSVQNTAHAGTLVGFRHDALKCLDYHHHQFSSSVYERETLITSARGHFRNQPCFVPPGTNKQILVICLHTFLYISILFEEGLDFMGFFLMIKCLCVE